MTPLVAIIVIALIGVLAVNVIGRARSGIRSVRSHHRALDTLGHITAQRPPLGARLPSAPMAARQAHIRILPPPEEIVEEVAPVVEEPETRAPVQLPVAASFRLAPAPPNNLWDTIEIRRLLGESDTPDAEDADARDLESDDPGEGAGDESPDGEDPPSAGATTHGATTHGATTNGATTNGATTNGATTNGATTNGATTNGATTNGSTANGATTHGATTHDAMTPSHGSAATNGFGSNGVNGSAANGWAPAITAGTKLNGTATTNATAPTNGAAVIESSGEGDRRQADGAAPHGTWADPEESSSGDDDTAGFDKPLRWAGLSPRWRRRAAASTIVAVAAVAAIVTFAEERHPGTKITVVPPPAPARPVPTAVTAAPRVAKRPAPVKLVSSTPVSATYRAGSRSRVTLKAVAPCWVEIRRPDAGGAQVYVATMAPGATESVTAPAWIRVGRPQAVAITVGGTAVSPPARPGIPYDLIFG